MIPAKLLICCSVVTLCAYAATAQVIPSPPKVLNSNAMIDSGEDAIPDIATDTTGNWIVCWESRDSLEDMIGTDADILYSRSTDNGVTWSPVAVLNTNATSDVGDDTDVHIATNENGVWLAIWESDDSLSDTIGTDADILFAKSVDNGESWTAPAALNSTAASDTGNDRNAAITTNGSGKWIVAWDSNENLGGTAGSDLDILYSTTSDSGDTWATVDVLNTNATVDAGSDQRPDIANDGTLRWIVVWDTSEPIGGNGFDLDIASAFSADDGATWSAPGNIFNTALTDTGQDLDPNIESGGASLFRTVWSSREDIFGVLGTDRDVLIGRTATGPTPWTDGVIDSDAFTDGARSDNNPRIVSDKTGNFVIIWAATGEDTAIEGGEGDIRLTHSNDNGGSSFSTTQLFNLNATIDAGRDSAPALATDRAGKWIAVWQSKNNLRGAGIDSDILYAPFELGAAAAFNASGQITLSGEAPLTCAVIEATLQGTNTTAVGVTDLSGQYLVTDLAAGIYDIRVLSPDVGSISVGTANLTTGSLAELNFDLVPAVVGTFVSGTVVDSDTSEPLVAVLVEALVNSVVVATTYTCGSGEYLLGLDGIKGPLDIELRFSLLNYQTRTLPDIALSPMGIEVNTDLTKAVAFPASLTGIVSSSSKGTSPVAGARITLRGPANLSATTDATGVYVFDQILGGAYSISVSATDFESRTTTKIVGASDAATESFSLQPIISAGSDGDPADLNDDGVVNSVDIQIIINIVLGEVVPAVVGDVNSDGSINSVDIQLVINTVLGI